MATLEAIRYHDGKLEILHQLKLPETTEYIRIGTTEDGFAAIKSMQVRGAPAIAIVGCLSLAAELRCASPDVLPSTAAEAVSLVSDKLDYLVSARPTAVNMQRARQAICASIADEALLTAADVLHRVIGEAECMLEADRRGNRAMGRAGAERILASVTERPVVILTHCNTGSLATAGYGTALGVIRAVHESGRLGHAYCTETRPYNQGARLTAYELVFEQIPSTLICDSMVGWLMQSRRVDAVVVGADRVARNGDVANKIGTYSIAVLAKHHSVAFYVAFPTTTFSADTASGAQITIEERPARELTHINGSRVAAPDVGVWNPAFDVTPAHLVTGGYVTQLGVFTADQLSRAILHPTGDN